MQKVNPKTDNTPTLPSSDAPARSFESLLAEVSNTALLKTFHHRFARVSQLPPTYGNLWYVLEEEYGAVQIFWTCAKYEHLEIGVGTQWEVRVQKTLTKAHVIGLLNRFLHGKHQPA